LEPFEEETNDNNDEKKTNKTKLTTDDEKFMSEEIISFIIAITTHSMTCPTPEKNFHHEERRLRLETKLCMQRLPGTLHFRNLE